MLISSIIKRYHNTYESPLNIIMSVAENRAFDLFIKEALPENSQIYDFKDTLFGNAEIDLILCNNKILHLEKCGSLSYFFHCPILIIDHDIKPKFIEKNIIEYQSNSIYSVALNSTISKSWDSVHNLILDYNFKDKNNLEQWRNLLYQISKIPFSIKENQPYVIKNETE